MPTPPPPPPIQRPLECYILQPMQNKVSHYSFIFQICLHEYGPDKISLNSLQHDSIIHWEIMSYKRELNLIKKFVFIVIMKCGPPAPWWFKLCPNANNHVYKINSILYKLSCHDTNSNDYISDPITLFSWVGTLGRWAREWAIFYSK